VKHISTYLIPLVRLLIIALIGGNWSAAIASPPEPGPHPNLSAETAGKEGKTYYDQWHQPVGGANRISPSSTLAVDEFGYVGDDSEPYAWIDATAGGTPVNFGNPDDGFSDMVDIGFEFDFYENTYTHLSIGTNGFISFDGGSSALSNQPLPQDTAPNNIIAPFWDDLTVETGAVYYKQFSSYFVIEWYQAVKFGTSDQLTFEVVLYENGDILFQYLDLNGDLESATVGIEDGDGINGLTYLHNAPGLASGEAIRFIRPGASARVKISPVYQSAFCINGGSTFHFSVKNIGELGPDTLNLTALSTVPGWTISFYGSDSTTPLVDSNQDAFIDTGALPEGSAAYVTVKVQPPESAAETDYTLINLTASSSIQGTKTTTAEIQVAIPAPFAQAYADSQAGINLNQSWKINTLTSKVATYFTGNTISLAGIAAGNYIYAWEKNGTKIVNNQTVNFSDIEYVVLNRYGRPIQTVSKITNYSDLATPTMIVNARYPAVAIAPNGMTGLLWVQYKFNLNTFKSNTNIHFAILDEDGDVAYGPVNLTDNDGWRGQGDTGVPQFNFPRLIATEDNHFFLAWVESIRLSAGDVTSLYFSTYTTSGVGVKASTKIRGSTAGSTLYIDPSYTETASGNILIAHSVYDQSSETYAINYAILDADGNTVVDFREIPGVNGWRADSVRFSSDHLLVTWTNPVMEQVSYVILNPDGDSILSGPVDLPLVGTRRPDYVSATMDKFGHAILTWLDVEWNDYLYYAAINWDGTVSTPPMVFASGWASNPLIQTSFEGQGNAPYDGTWRVLLPKVRR
jgi:hypothetical protein